MPESTTLESNKVKKLLSLALTEKLETPTISGNLDLPGFKIIDTLGTGGMGTVYRAKHLDLGRTVALKIFTPKAKDHDLFVERIKREGKLMAELKHPNVLGIYDATVLDDGSPYLVLEYIKGEDLQKKLMREERLSQLTAIRIAIHVCEALSAVHKIGIIHRDIKPANVLLGKNGAVKVTDFGISKDTRSAEEHTSLTMTGTTVGTADYMSPEQTRNEELTPRSDLYSVGVLLYEMIMGVTPRGNFESLGKSGVCKPLEQLIMRCLQRDRQKRPATAATLSHSLKKIEKRINTRSHSNLKALLLSSILALCAIALVIYSTTRHKKRSNVTSTPLSTTTINSIEKQLLGVWGNVPSDGHQLMFNSHGLFIHLTKTKHSTQQHQGKWESSKHGGFYLHYLTNQDTPITHLRLKDNHIRFTNPFNTEQLPEHSHLILSKSSQLP